MLKIKLFTQNSRINSLDRCFWKTTSCQPNWEWLTESQCPRHANKDLTMTSSSGNLLQQMERLLNLSDLLCNVQDVQTEILLLWVQFHKQCPLYLQQPLMHLISELALERITWLNIKETKQFPHFMTCKNLNWILSNLAAVRKLWHLITECYWSNKTIGNRFSLFLGMNLSRIF